MKKLLARIKTRNGISMTEYLIILSIVAIAAIAVVGLFGKQIKSVFTANTAAMAGKEKSNADVSDDGQVKKSSMENFTEGTAKE